MSDAFERVELDQGSYAYDVVRGPAGAPRIVVVPPLGIPGAALAPFVDRLSRALEVHLIELPGTGRGSGLRAGTSTRSLGSALRAVLARRGLGRVHAFGVSLGGMVLQWAAIDGAGCFERIVLASTAAHGLSAALSGLAPKLALARGLASSGPPALGLARGILSDHVRDDPRRMDPIARGIVEHPRDPEEVAWLIAAAVRHDARAELGHIRAPVRIVSGDRDEIVPLALQRELAEALGARQEIVAGAGHDVTSDQPERTAEIVESFVLAPAAGGPQRRA